MDLKHDRDYWETSFAVRRADLDRVARRIERTGEAHTLTRLTRRLIRGRLRYGPERVRVPESSAAGDDMAEPIGSSVLRPERIEVRLWDPAAAWQAGDLAIFAVPVPHRRLQTFSPAVGRVLKTQGNSVIVTIDGQRGTRIYGTATRRREDKDLDRWRRSIEDLVTVLEDRTDEPSCIDYVFWLHGERIVSLLRNALRDDTRLVALEERWFLAKLAARPTEDQLLGLARAMLRDPKETITYADLLALMPAATIEGDAGRFGLALAMRERPDLFSNVEVGGRTRWALAGPPPGEYTARLAAYDPDTYAVLCEPGDTLSPESAQRLWDLDLLTVVIDRVERRPSTGSGQTGRREGWQGW
ncbi:MAG: hypothetical protein ACP5KN_21405 [Armatimonadota bacterium]